MSPAEADVCIFSCCSTSVSPGGSESSSFKAAQCLHSVAMITASPSRHRQALVNFLDCFLICKMGIVSSLKLWVFFSPRGTLEKMCVQLPCKL